MIEETEFARRAAALGVAPRQIARDHLLSHLIHGLSRVSGVVFVGGTALNRTHLADLRLSEDLDLYQREGEPLVVAESLLERVQYEFPDTAMRTERGPVFTVTISSEDVQVRVQVIGDRPDWEKIPKALAPVRLHYSDLPPDVELEVPTPGGFVAMKFAAYVDRRSPRDLFDLGGLVEAGFVDRHALELTRALIGRRLFPDEFRSPPKRETWENELAHQVNSLAEAPRVLAAVFGRLSAIEGWNG